MGRRGEGGPSVVGRDVRAFLGRGEAGKIGLACTGKKGGKARTIRPTKMRKQNEWGKGNQENMAPLTRNIVIHFLDASLLARFLLRLLLLELVEDVHDQSRHLCCYWRRCLRSKVSEAGGFLFVVSKMDIIGWRDTYG